VQNRSIQFNLKEQNNEQKLESLVYNPRYLAHAIMSD